MLAGNVVNPLLSVRRELVRTEDLHTCGMTDDRDSERGIMWIGWNRELHAHGWVWMGPGRLSRNLRATLTVFHQHTAPFGRGDMFGQLWTASTQPTSQYPLAPYQMHNFGNTNWKGACGFVEGGVHSPYPRHLQLPPGRQTRQAVLLFRSTKNLGSWSKTTTNEPLKIFLPSSLSLVLPPSLLGTVFTVTNNRPRSCSAPSFPLSAKVMILNVCPALCIEIGYPRRKPCHSKPQS